MAQDCCPEGVVSTLKDRVGGSAATVATAISDPSDSSFNVSSSPRGFVDGGTADGTKKNPSVSDHGDGRCTSSSKRSPKKALRGSMEEKLSATKRAMQRMTPNLETRMSEQGFTIHKLDLPEGLFSSEQGQASKSCSSGSSAKAVSISSSSNPKQAVTLYGREKEISELSNALDSCCKVAESENTSKKFHIVMIAGESGVGKSALAKQLKYTRHLNNDGSYFCMGKYDVSDEVGGAPLTGISTALASFSRQIMSSTDEEQERVRNCVRKFFGLDEQQPSKNAKDGALVPAIPVEFQTLSDFVPNLANISNLDLSNTSSMSQKSGSSNKTQLQVLLHRFFQAICSPENPVVLVLDDLQWADKASLDLIQGLVREKAIPGFLVVGCYRSNEVTKEHALANVIESIENNKKHISLTTIEIGNLSFADIQMLTSTALHDQYASQEQLEGLSSVLQKKTAGNPYFLILFLKKLQKTGALKYNIGLMTWQWDNEAISHGMDVTENVAEFIRKNLESSISIAASCLLQIGACLGNVFEESLIILLTTRLVKDPSTTAILCSGASTSSETLEVLLKDNPSESEICEGLQKGLQECVEGGYLCTNSMEESSSTVFRFVHDKVQEAALSLIAAEAIPKLRYCIGSIMINDLSTEKLEENLFIAVDCINSSDMILRDQLGARKFLDLNIRAGEKAMLTSAFEAAVVYFHEAQSTLEHIEKMEALSWVDAPDLRCLGLQLFNKACIADFSAGNIEGCMLHINQVLEKRSLQIEDQLVVYSVLSAVRTAQEKHSEEYKTTMAVLKQLGVKFPPNFALNLGALVADLRKTKSVIGDRDVQAFINLPLMDDPICALKMKLMDRAQNTAYMLGEKCQTLFGMRGVRWTVKYGIADTSAIMIGAFASQLISTFGEFKLAAEMSKVADAMSNLPVCSQTKARVSMLVNFYGLAWSTPLKTLLKPLLYGNEAGLKNGDLENASILAFCYVMFANTAGLPLKTILDDIKDFQEQMSIYHIEHAFKMCLPQLQFVMNMIDSGGSHSSFLSGEAMQFDSLMEHLIAANHVYMQDQVRCLQLFLAFYLDDLELAWKMACESKKTDLTCRGQVTVWRRVFFVGLIAFAYARKAAASRSKKILGLSLAVWKKVGNANMARIEDWVKKGNVNCIHLYRMLEAESISVTSKRKDSSLTAYEISIVASTRSGYTHDRALAYELAAEYLLSIGETCNLSRYQNQALLAYEQWGASAKLRLLEDKWSIKA